MKIGEMRAEEAQVFDSHEGYHEFHDEETQEPHGSFEVFWHGGEADAEQVLEHIRMGGTSWPVGWYWWACFPGCLPDSEFFGPFATSRQAHDDAEEVT
jgi:hypothetical protein